jgi:hypothetical protein
MTPAESIYFGAMRQEAELRQAQAAEVELAIRLMLPIVKKWPNCIEAVEVLERVKAEAIDRRVASATALDDISKILGGKCKSRAERRNCDVRLTKLNEEWKIEPSLVAAANERIRLATVGPKPVLSAYSQRVWTEEDWQRGCE